MGIRVEFNPDLALRNISEFKNGNRKEEECIPEDIEVGKTYEGSELFRRQPSVTFLFFGNFPFGNFLPLFRRQPSVTSFGNLLR